MHAPSNRKMFILAKYAAVCAAVPNCQRVEFAEEVGVKAEEREFRPWYYGISFEKRVRTGSVSGARTDHCFVPERLARSLSAKHATNPPQSLVLRRSSFDNPKFHRVSPPENPLRILLLQRRCPRCIPAGHGLTRLEGHPQAHPGSAP